MDRRCSDRGAAGYEGLVKRAAFLIALAASACDQELHSAEPEAGVAWTAVIEAGEDGRFLRATPLLPYDGRANSFAQHEDAKTVWIAGWTAEEIAVLGTPTGDALKEVVGCDPPLPAPHWQARVLGGEAKDAIMPALTGTWMRDRCPVLETADVDVRCVFTRCFAYTRQTGCDVAIDLESCSFPTVRGRIHPDGTLCLEPGAQCLASNEDHPVLNCSSPEACEIHIWPNPGVPDWEVIETKVVESATERVPFSGDGGLYPIMAHSGWFADLVVLGDRVLVSTHAGRFQDGRLCDHPLPMEARSFALDTLAPIATSTLPPCTSKLERDPHGDGFIGFFRGAAPSWNAGRFDKEGRLLASAPIAMPDDRVWDPFASIVDLERDRVWVTFSAFENGGAYALYYLQLSTWTVERVDVTEDESSLGIALSQNGTVVIAHEKAAARFYDPESERTEGYARLAALLGSVRLGSIAFLDAANLFVMPVPNDDPSIYLFSGTGVIEHRRGFLATRDYGPYRASVWPANRDYALIGAGSNSDTPPRRSVLTLYDGRTDRFLPGVLEVGFGATTHMRTGERAVYVGFSWDARLMRIEPR